MIGPGARRPLLLAAIVLIATTAYEMGWMTVTIADGLSGRQKLLAPVLASSSAPFAAMLGLVVAIIAGVRSRVLAVAGLALACWEASGAAAPWAWRSLSDGAGLMPGGTTVSTVVMALLWAAALALLSLIVMRSTSRIAAVDVQGDSP